MSDKLKERQQKYDQVRVSFVTFTANFLFLISFPLCRKKILF